MTYLSKSTIVVSMLLMVTAIYAQSPRTTLRGRIVDAQTLTPVDAVHIQTGRAGTYSDEQGWFTLAVTPADTLTFSHVGYRSYATAASSSPDTLRVFLVANEVLLKEVVVQDLLTEARFKREVLHTRLSPSKEATHAQRNVANAQKLYLSGYVPSMSSRDNYDRYIQGPQEVKLFSSGPSGGIVRAIRQLARSGRTGPIARMHSPRPPLDLSRLSTPTDTTQVDTTQSLQVQTEPRP